MEENAISLMMTLFRLDQVASAAVRKLHDALAVSASCVSNHLHCTGILIFKIRAIFSAILANIKNKAADTRHDRS